MLRGTIAAEPNADSSLKGPAAMRESIVTLGLAGALAAPALASAQQAAVPASPHTLTGNVGLFSSYRFRGIDQTFGKPALQGGVDYSHASGIYLGNWNSNVQQGAGYPGGNLEMDFYGGWVLAASYIDTNAHGNCSGSFFTDPYCFPNSTATRTKDAGRSTAVISVSKTF
jgi:hypothetical protein